MSRELATQDTQHTMAYNTLMNMLTYRRPSGSKTEAEFCAKYIEPLGVTRDEAGNYWLDLDSTSRVLYSCHYDTVHHADGLQTVACSKGGVAMLVDKTSDCLGADDTVGVWLMREMILAKVPGLYIFHSAEEIGGKGSQFIADNHAGELNGIHVAIAFDRRGKRDVITHQYSGRTASDNFARSLAVQLGMDYRPSSHGIFTDTANYAGIIPECTNLSVGYLNEHSSDESLDMTHALRLRARLIRGLDESQLAIERDPAAVEAYDWADYGGYDNGEHANSVQDIVKLYPDLVADWLEQAGYDARSLLDEIGRIHPDQWR